MASDSPQSPQSGPYNTPGAGSYDIEQPDKTLSHRPRPPAFGFGTDKKRITELHMHREIKESRPGPGTYDQEPSVGTQIASVKPSSPRWGFGTSERHTLSKTYISKEAFVDTDPNKTNIIPLTPGPGTYEQTPEVVTARSVQTHTFGIRPNHISGEIRPSTNAVVGPGSYSHRSYLGTQQESFKKTFPSFKIGTSTREKSALCHNPGFKPDSMFLKVAPGPGSYNEDVSSISRAPVLSKQKSSFVTELGRAPKFALRKDHKVPGAGTYDTNVSTLARQVRSNYKTSPSWGFGSSKRPAINAGMFG